MKKQMRILIRILLIPALVFITYIVVILLLNSLKDYKPVNSILYNSAPQQSTPLNNDSCFSVLSWNIGYAGLDDKSDFFYDGGSMVRPAKDKLERNFQDILNRIQTADSIDFLLLQEVDIASARSYYQDQFSSIKASMQKYHAVFAKNYHVPFVPLPLLKPMGKVVSGLSIFSHVLPEQSNLYVFPDNYSWPKKLFMPDRCFVKNAYSLLNGKRLHIINTHNSAFDDGTLREAQLRLIFEQMQLLYEKGDYVIAGGDWNINPPRYDMLLSGSGDRGFDIPMGNNIPLPDTGWIFAFDPDYPTNRKVASAYTRGITPTTIIDFFVCSPNIRVHNVKTVYDGFKHADHHAVYMRFELIR